MYNFSGFFLLPFHLGRGNGFNVFCILLHSLAFILEVAYRLKKIQILNKHIAICLYLKVSLFFEWVLQMCKIIWCAVSSFQTIVNAERSSFALCIAFLVFKIPGKGSDSCALWWWLGNSMERKAPYSDTHEWACYALQHTKSCLDPGNTLQTPSDLHLKYF